MRLRRRSAGVRLIALGAIVVLGAAGFLALSLNRPYRGFESGGVFVEVAKGTSTPELARQLASAGVVRSPWEFWAVRALHPHTRLQAGEYLFERAATPFTVFHRIARGDVFFFELTVPEGSNIFDIAALVDQLGIIPPDDFLAAAADPSLIRNLDPSAPSLEGYLFPSTYKLKRHTTARQLCRMLTTEFRKQWKRLGTPGANVHATVTLASLVEKETPTPSERPLVASVFHNRLVKGMTLDCDPTTIYAALLEKRFRGTIYRSDLESENAYNTYRHPGLPPGPIANPGAAALRAALFPASTDYLYFVAKSDGSGSHFARTLEEHNRNVKEYRLEHSGKAAESPAAPGVSRTRPPGAGGRK